MRSVKKQHILLAIGFFGIIGCFAPTMYGAFLRSTYSVYHNSWSNVQSPLPPILIPLEGQHMYVIDISLSDIYDIRGNYTIFFDADLIITQQLNLTADYDQSSVSFSCTYYQIPDHDVALNLSIFIISGSGCTVGILKDWGPSSDIWLIIGGSSGIGFIVFILFVLGSASALAHEQPPLKVEEIRSKGKVNPMEGDFGKGTKDKKQTSIDALIGPHGLF